MSIVSMTLAEIKKLPKSTPEEIAFLEAFEDKDIFLTAHPLRT